MKKIILVVAIMSLLFTLYGETTLLELAEFRTIDTIDGEIFWAIPNTNSNVKAQQLTINDGQVVVMQEVDLPDTLEVFGYNDYPKILAVNSDYFGSGFILAVGQNLISWLSNGDSSAFNFLYFQNDVLGIKRYGEHNIYIFFNLLDSAGQYHGGSSIYQINLQQGGGGSTVFGGPEICVDRNYFLSAVGGSVVVSESSIATVAIYRSENSVTPYDYQIIYEPAYTKTVAVFVGDDNSEDVYALQVRPNGSRYKARLVKYQGANNNLVVVCPEFDIFVLNRTFIKRLGDWLYFGGSLGIMKYHFPTQLITNFNNFESSSYLGYANYWRDISVGGDKMCIVLRRGLLLYEQTGSIIITKEPNEPVIAFSGQNNVDLISVDIFAYNEDVNLQSLEIRRGSYGTDFTQCFENIKIIDNGIEIYGVVNEHNIVFENINLVVESNSWKTIHFFGDINQITIIDTVRLIIDDHNVVAIDAISGSTAAVSLAYGQFLPKSDIIVMPSQVEYYMDIFPYRNPVIDLSDNIRYVIDTLYVYPGQTLFYEGVVNPNYYNQSVIVGIDAYVTFDHSQFNEIWSAWQSSELYNNGLTYINGTQLSWVANDYLGITSCGLYDASLQTQLEVGEMSTIFLSLNLTKNTFDGISIESHLNNKTIIANSGIIGDIDGSGTVDSNDSALGIQQWINQYLFDTQFNPIEEVNLARQACLFPHASSANIWAINGYVNNPDDPFFSSLGIGQEFELGQQMIPGFTNDNGSVFIETNDNFVSIFWQNSDGSYHGQDILINGERSLKWTESRIEPALVNLDRDQVIFQIPSDARVLSVASRQISYYPSDIADYNYSPMTPWLSSAYPNPFCSSTAVKFNQTDNSPTTVAVYNIKGQFIRTLINDQKLSLGEHSFVWDGKTNSGQPVSAGIYFFKMKSGTFSATRKMILMK